MRSTSLLAAGLTLCLAACSPSGARPDPTQIEAAALTQANNLLTPSGKTIASTATPRSSPPALIFPASTDGAPPTPPPPATPDLTVSPLTMSTVGPPPTSQAAPGAAGVQPADCSHPLRLADFPLKARVLVKNNTHGPVAFAMGLNASGANAPCGFLSWPDIPAGDAIVANVPQLAPDSGLPCYWVNAWINDPRRRSTLSDGGFCIDSPGRWVININYNGVRLAGR